jgi:hypothetical protein
LALDARIDIDMRMPRYGIARSIPLGTLCLPKRSSVLVGQHAMVLALAGVFAGDAASRRYRALLAGMMLRCCFVSLI